METDMKLSPLTVRRLREAKNWSQEQLANAAGLSLRTIQRVETEGTASRETRVCLAAALDVDVSDISELQPQPVRTPNANFGMTYSLVGLTMLIAASISGALNVVHYIAVFFLLFGLMCYAYEYLRSATKT
jgi:transcriptional regulator with XRE-family HTH domain